MLAFFIKYYFIFLCGTFICLKIVNHNLSSKLLRYFLFFFPFILTSLTYLLKLYLAELTYAVPLLLLWLGISFFTLRPQATFIATIIAFVVSYSLSILSGFISLIIIAPIHYNSPSFPYYILAVFTAILQSLLTIALFHIKRFQKGMPFVFSTNVMNVATAVCLLLIAFLIFKPSKHSNFWLQVFSLSLFFIAVPILIYWWQSQLTKSYKHSLQIRELESLRTELQEKDKQIDELTQQNERLGRLIHKDNKLIPAMENAVSEYLVSEFKDAEESINKGNTLLIELHNLSNSRSNVISEIYANKSKQFATSIPSLDTLLNYMDKRARQDGIKLSVHIALALGDYVPCIISADDFSTPII